jgi:hypothetical protein
MKEILRRAKFTFIAKFLLLRYQVYLLASARKLWCSNQE